MKIQSPVFVLEKNITTTPFQWLAVGAFVYLNLFATLLLAQKSDLFLNDGVLIQKELPNLEIRHLIIDRKFGFLYCATKDGLVRYDGQEFKTFRYGIHTSEVLSIAEGDSGVIWWLDRRGFLFNTQKGVVDSLGLNGNLFADNHGGIWFCNANSSQIFHYESGNQGAFYLCKRVFELWNYGVQNISKGEKIVAWPKVSVLKKNYTDQNPALKNLLQLTHFHVLHIGEAQQNKGQLIVVQDTLSNHFLIHIANGLVECSPMPKGKTLLESYDFIADNELNVYSIEGEKMGLTLKGIAPNDIDLRRYCLAKFNSFWCLYNRDEGDLYIIKNQKMVFMGNFEEISNLTANGKSTIYLGTPNGLIIQNITYKHFSTKNGAPHRIWMALQQNGGIYYIASYSHGLYKFNGKHFEKIILPKGVGNYFYNHGLKDTHGNLWFTNDHGVVKVAPSGKIGSIETDAACTYIFENNDSILVGSKDTMQIIKNGKIIGGVTAKANNRFIISIVKDHSNNFWLGSYEGLRRWDGKDTTTEDFTKKLSQYADGVISQWIDPKGNLWLGTTAGLYFCHQSDLNTLRNLKKIAVPTLQIKFLQPFEHNRLLVGLPNMLVEIDLEAFNKGNSHYVVRYHTDKDGFKSMGIEQNGILKDKDGHYWICSTNGLTEILPEFLDEQVKTPKGSRWNEIKLLRNGSTNDSVISGERFSTNSSQKILENHESSLLFEFGSCHIGFPVSYVCELFKDDKLIDKDSTEETQKRFVGLAHGEYVFQITPVTISGVRGETLRYFFKIKPMFHQTGWGITAISLSILLVILCLFYYYYRKKIKASRQKEEESMLKLWMLANQLDNHFTYNLIGSIGEMLSEADEETITRAISNFSALFEPYFINFESINQPLKKELEYMTTYIELEQMMHPSKFEFQSFIHDDIDLQCDIPKSIVLNFVNNAIKYGLESLSNDKGILRVSAVLNASMTEIIVTIEDNGIGRERALALSKRSTGTSGAMMVKLFAWLNVRHPLVDSHFSVIDLKDEHGNSAGTKVILVLPYPTI